MPSAIRASSVRTVSSSVLERHRVTTWIGRVPCPAPPASRRPTVSTPDLVRTFSALQSLLLTAQGIDEFLTQVARLAAGVAQPAASCGITIRRHGQPLTVASSDARAEQVDQAQYGAGTGPCLDSLETGAIIDVPDLTADTRWADFRRQALAHGIRS